MLAYMQTGVNVPVETDSLYTPVIPRDCQL